MPTETIRVFLASTTEDLADHRDAVAKILEGMDMLAVRVHELGSHPRPQVATCRDYAAKADAVVVIVAHRYGWIPTRAEGGDGERSITWLEMAAAEAAGKPVFGFLVDEKEPWSERREQDRLLSATSVEEAVQVWRAVRGLVRFKAEVAKRVYADFSTPATLAGRVAISLIRHFRPPDKPTTPPGTAGRGISVVNQNTQIGTQMVARRIDVAQLEERIESLVRRLIEEPPG